MLCENLNIVDGALTFGGADLYSLFEKYSTPLYVMDEERIRSNIRAYTSAAREAFGDNFEILYASKACSFKEIYRIAESENIGVDVVSEGEIYTAKVAGFPMHRALFHGNNKTDGEISFAMDCSVGCFVVDSTEELYAVSREAQRRGIVQKILLRITPGIDAHTFKAVRTGSVDSKFGCAIQTGDAEKITRLALSLKGIDLAGFHCHIGSQLFDSQCFLKCADVMLSFIADIRRNLGFTARELDLGGGIGVPYLENTEPADIRSIILGVSEHIKAAINKLSIPMPKIMLEPGRSIVADAGLTLYTVGTVKKIEGHKNYVAVDGSMADNPRYALYRAPYTVVAPQKMDESDTMICSVVGKCCESGDILQENVVLPASLKRGDLLAVLTTGAYNYSMSSNYNRLTRPAVVMVSKGTARLAVRRESLLDLVKNDI